MRYCIEFECNQKVDENRTQEAVQMLYNAIQMLPQLLLRELEYEKYLFILINIDKFENMQNKINGSFMYELKRIYININSDILETLFYEVGTYIYFRYFSRNLSSEIVFRREKNNMKHIDNSLEYDENMKEYYAQIFVYYFFRKDELKEHLPYTYEKMDTVMRKFKER